MDLNTAQLLISTFSRSGFFLSVSTGLCEQCPGGFSCLANNRTLCVVGSYCPPGTFLPIACPTGSVAPSSGSSECTPCDEGKFSNTTESCVSCQTGRFNARRNMSECELCSLGRYQNALGQTTCLDCPVGASCLGGQAQFQVCPPGTFGNLSSASGCQLCDYGRFSEFFNSTVCAECTPGKYQDRMGQSLCSCCLPGSFAEFDSATRCFPVRVLELTDAIAPLLT